MISYHVVDQTRSYITHPGKLPITGLANKSIELLQHNDNVTDEER